MTVCIFFCPAPGWEFCPKERYFWHFGMDSLLHATKTHKGSRGNQIWTEVWGQHSNGGAVGKCSLVAGGINNSSKISKIQHTFDVILTKSFKNSFNSWQRSSKTNKSLFLSSWIVGNCQELSGTEHCRGHTTGLSMFHQDKSATSLPTPFWSEMRG